MLNADAVAPPPVARAPLRYGRLVVGGGSAGRRHLANLALLGETGLAVYRTGLGTLPTPAWLPVESDLQAALARRPGAVFVCNPTALHLEVALAAARAGAHLFIEKPVGHSLEGLDELSAIARSSGLVTMVGYQYRHHPVLRRVREWIAQGRVGRLISARARWGERLGDWHPWEDCRRSYSARRDLGGGVLLTLSHAFDTLRWLMGEVAQVQAATARRGAVEMDVEDTAAALLHFCSGALGIVDLDYVERPRRFTLHVVGQDGAIAWEDADGTAALVDGEGRLVERARPPAGFERDQLFVAEMRHFLACLRGTEEPRCALGEGIATLRVALAALRSAEEGRRIDV